MRKVYHLTSQHSFIVASVLAVAGVIVYLWIVLHAPWFGVKLDREPEQVGKVLWVDPSVTSLGLKPGDVVTGFSDAKGKKAQLQPLSLVSDPDRSGNFAALNALFDNAKKLYEVTNQPWVNFHLSDGRVLTLERQVRSLSTLSPRMLIMASGIIPFIVGAGVWSYRRREPASQMLLLAGAAFMGIALSNLLYAYRQPSLDPDLFKAAVAVNRLSTYLFFFANFAVFLVYPKPLVKVRKLWLGVFIVLALFANEIWQGVELPGNTYAFPVVCSLPLILATIIVQWFLSDKDPVARASLQWFVLVMMTGTFIVGGLYFFPIFLGSPPIFSVEGAFAIGIFSNLGLIMAVVKFRLFQLGRWWLTAWFWLLGGGSVVILDFALAFLLNVAPSYVISVSILLVGWVYFPIRQWVWRRIFWQGEDPMQWLSRDLIQALVSSVDNQTLDRNWQKILTRLFSPLQCKVYPDFLNAPRVEAEGTELLVPNASGQGYVLLGYRSNGRHLFSPDDSALVATLLDMIAPAIHSRTIIQSERDRIMRDLHDDVGARLLTLRHRVNDPEVSDLVQAAIRALRESIYQLEQPQGCTLGEAAADWRLELSERLEPTEVTFTWYLDPKLKTLQLSAHQRISIGRILRECISNILRHSQAKHIDIRLEYHKHHWSLWVAQDGPAEPLQDWKPGTGIATIKRRASELGATVNWQEYEGGISTQLTVPYHNEVTNDKT